jgi:hypothetical protein
LPASTARRTPTETGNGRGGLDKFGGKAGAKLRSARRELSQMPQVPPRVADELTGSKRRSCLVAENSFDFPGNKDEGVRDMLAPLQESELSQMHGGVARCGCGYAILRETPHKPMEPLCAIER